MALLVERMQRELDELHLKNRIPEPWQKLEWAREEDGEPCRVPSHQDTGTPMPGPGMQGKYLLPQEYEVRIAGQTN